MRAEKINDFFDTAHPCTTIGEETATRTFPTVIAGTSAMTYSFMKFVRRPDEEAKMDKKLTLRLDESLIDHAKQHAEKTGKSVSQMFANFVIALDGLEARKQPDAENALDVDTLLPLTRSLLGILETYGEDEVKQAYHHYLEEKYR